ncbi:MAG: hypothetical protein IJZ94_04845 [Clostridia bacterium]|nr:hypothetical protein [Clostridia bacterium]
MISDKKVKIVTLTLNPVIDTHYQFGKFNIADENKPLSVITNAAGKGINISRALARFGIKSKAVALLGRQNADYFLNMLKADGVDCTYILAEGKVREAISLNTAGIPETRIITDTFTTSEDLLEQAMAHVNSECTSDTYIAISGKVPAGISRQAFINACKNVYGKLILDTSSLGAEDLCEAKPWLIKPNQQEANALMGISDCSACGLPAARLLLQKGCASNIIISLGADGFVYAGEYGEATVKVPQNDAKSTVGAGDNTIAGLLFGLYNNFDFINCLKIGAAFGSASCLEYGTVPPAVETVMRILPEIKLIK